MPHHTQLVPYRNNEVVLYMDEVSGTDVTLRSLAKKPEAPNQSAALLENDNDPARNRPPTYGPEMDDLEPESRRRRGEGNEADHRGIDDSFLPPVYPTVSRPRLPFDVNIYQQKKTLAQGMMDLALISANANQLRYVLQSQGHPYYLASLSMICTSLFLQIVVGIGLIWNSTYNVKKDAQVFKANKANNFTVIGIFLVTILNVFISSFGVAEPTGIGNAPFTEEHNIQDTEMLKDS